MVEQTRREFLEAAGLAATAAPLLKSTESYNRISPRPNLIVVMSDDQGNWDLSCEGYQQLKTPHLDPLKREGISFTNFYVTPLRSPTRASLMTGRHNYRTGVADTFVGVSMMRPDEATVARGPHPVHTVLGAREANPTRLNARKLLGPHAARTPLTWGQVHRMSAPAGFGHFMVHMRKVGRYEPTCRFGPADAAGIPVMKDGEPFLRLEKVSVHHPVQDGARSVTFHVNFASGKGRIEAFLAGQRRDGAAVSPFFIDVKCRDL